MNNSVQNDHVGDGMPETPTVYTSPHDSADKVSDNDNLVGRPTALLDRAPSVERILEEVRAMDIVKMTISLNKRNSRTSKGGLTTQQSNGGRGGRRKGRWIQARETGRGRGHCNGNWGGSYPDPRYSDLMSNTEHPWYDSAVSDLFALFFFLLTSSYFRHSYYQNGSNGNN